MGNILDYEVQCIPSCIQKSTCSWAGLIVFVKVVLAEQDARNVTQASCGIFQQVWLDAYREKEGLPWEKSYPVPGISLNYPRF